MSYFYRFILVLIALGALYTLYGIGHFKWMYHSVNNTNAEFLISGNLESDITVVEFLNYGCKHCKTIHPTVEALQEVRDDVRYIIRPITFLQPEKENVTRIAIAAGLQGKFQEMHKAFMEYPETDIPDDFIKETALLYGLNYDQLIEDSNGKKVEKIIEANMKAIGHAGIFSVPSFMIGKNIYFVSDEYVPDLKQLLEVVPTSTP